MPSWQQRSGGGGGGGPRGGGRGNFNNFSGGRGGGPSDRNCTSHCYNFQSVEFFGILISFFFVQQQVISIRIEVEVDHLEADVFKLVGMRLLIITDKTISIKAIPAIIVTTDLQIMVREDEGTMRGHSIKITIKIIEVDRTALARDQIIIDGKIENSSFHRLLMLFLFY